MHKTKSSITTLFISATWSRVRDKILHITCLSFGDIPNALRFQEYYFLIWNPIKEWFSDSWILKTQANPIRWMVSITIVESITSDRTFISTFKKVRTKFQTSTLKFRFVKAGRLEQKWIISWFQRPQTGWCVFFSVGRTVGYNFFKHTTRL